MAAGRKARDLTGQQYGSWTVLSRAENTISRKVMWSCRCACGTVSDVQAGNLTAGRSKQCGSCRSRKMAQARKRRRAGEV